MNSLDRLSEELIEKIAIAVPLRDMEAFCLTSWKLSRIGFDRLQEHLALKKEYLSYRCSLNGPRSLWILLEAVLKNPTIGDYVETLQTSTQRNWPSTQYAVDMLYDAASVHIPQDCVAYWQALFRQRDEATLISLLMFLLPNLSTLNLRCIRDREDLLPRILSHITDMKVPGAPLSNLTSVTIRNFDPRLLSDLKAIEYFALLPSVKSISLVYAACHHSHPDRPHPLLPKSSNVANLSLRNCKIEPEALNKLLASFKSLRSFSSIGSYCTDPNTGTADPVSATSTLLAHAKTTLETLTFRPISTRRKARMDYVGLDYVGPLYGFESLRVLEIGLDMLLRPSDFSDINALANALPSTIETLCLAMNVSLLDEELISRMLWRLPELKSKQFANLKTVKISTGVDHKILDRYWFSRYSAGGGMKNCVVEGIHFVESKNMLY